ncbi:METTL5 family protein [archaeon]|nr:METTL5 family protein [archaeon]
MTKKKLEIALEGLRGFEDPKIALEQYATPAPIVAEIINLAYLKGDIEGKRVFDLGCGTGKFAIGCALMGAKEVIGFDKDADALKIAKENSERLNVDINWIKSDVKDIKGKCDTVFQNPPFGVHKKGADKIFLEKGLESGKVLYSFHNANTREFVTSYINELGGAVSDLVRVDFLLPHSYGFHRKEKKETSVDIYRILGE